MPSYELTEDAESDLREIWRYTCNRWSEKQADLYLDALKAGCERLATGEALCKTFPQIHPHLKSCRCEQHYLFFPQAENLPPVVIAFLHKRMDLLTRLQERL